MTNLAEKWIQAKFEEDKAKQIRLAYEEQILKSGVNLKDEGSNGYLDILTITTGYNRKWDQDEIRKLDQAGSLPHNSFKIEYKEVRKNTKAIEDMSPAYWRDTFEPLLTLTPKKPSFKEKK